MSPTIDAFLRSWPFDPWLLAALLVTAGIYVRGWLRLRRRDPVRWHRGQLAAFTGGLASIFLALASPIEPFAGLLLQVHMAQHLLLTMVAPPLCWLGAPLLPLLRGLPEPVRVYWAAPLFRSRPLRQVFRRLTHPLGALPLFIAATWLWHVPALYVAALRSSGWHYVQHACFLGTALLFWYPVVRPYPARPRWSTWLLFPTLILADVQNTVLSALLTFSDRVLYAPYAQVPRLGGLSALDDQSAAGVLMWVPGSLVYLLPLFGIGVRLLSGEPRGTSQHLATALLEFTPHPSPPPQGGRGPEMALPDASPPPLWGRARVGGRSRLAVPQGQENRDQLLRQPVRRLPATGQHPLPVLAVIPSGCGGTGPSARGGFDLLRVPLLGSFLRWRHARRALQLPLAVLAGALIYDGLCGPQASPMNLAGVLPWIHWRGLVVLGLLAAGNVSCMACPFTLPRSLARRWLPARHRWPRRLRSKWLAALLVAVFLWAYEAFALWDSPRWTAWIALAYFGAAFVVDGLFRDASFCKYLCPIGQFNFVQSLASPLEVQVRDPDVCASCRTRDCIRGRDGIPGCELRLVQPRKSGNMDCTFCLDCVHACPHENVGMLAGLPGRDLLHDPVRSGVGRFGKRPDLAVLVLVFVFGAFANAGGMVGPLVGWQDRLSSLLGQRSPLMVTTLYYLCALLVLPVLAVGFAAFLGRRWGRLEASWLDVCTRFSFCLVPLGFGMWLAHSSFHFLASYETVIPTAQRFAGDLGWVGSGEPDWVRACCRPAAEWLTHLEILFLDLGLLLSLYVGDRIALAQSARPLRAVQAFLPWAVLIGLLFAAGVWIVLQPMQMRGMMLGAG